MIGEAPVVPALSDPLGADGRGDILDVQGLDVGTVVTHEPDWIVASPGKVAEIRTLEHDVPVDQIEEAVDLVAGLDWGADVVMETGAHSLPEGHLTHGVQKVGE